ncbi:hypothetical protein DP117_32115 [Brasilonema sp. UFV-L1]|nr:hypothetical protein [Brasilonema sp. UFV-L1]
MEYTPPQPSPRARGGCLRCAGGVSLYFTNLQSAVIKATASEWVKAFLEWAVNHHHNVPPLCDYALSRESMYIDTPTACEN